MYDEEHLQTYYSFFDRITHIYNHLGMSFISKTMNLLYPHSIRKFYPLPNDQVPQQVSTAEIDLPVGYRVNPYR